MITKEHEGRARHLEQKYPISRALQVGVDAARAYLQALEEGALPILEQEQQVQQLLKQMARLKCEEEANHKRIQSAYMSENSIQGDKLIEEELEAKEAIIEKSSI